MPANPDLLKRTRKALMYGLGTIDIPVDEDVMKFFQRRLKYMFMDLKRDVDTYLAKVK